MNDSILYAENKEIFTVKEAARYLTVSETTIYKLIHSGIINARMLGCRYKIEASEINRYFSSLNKSENQP